MSDAPPSRRAEKTRQAAIGLLIGSLLVTLGDWVLENRREIREAVREFLAD